MKIYLVEFWDMKNDQAFKLISLLLNTLEVHFVFLIVRLPLISAVVKYVGVASAEYIFAAKVDFG